MFCENCGINLPDGAKFCGGCGARTEPQPAAAAVTAAPPSLQSAPAQAYPPPVQPSYSPAQPAYAPVSRYPSSPAGTDTLGVGTYVGMFLLLCIPLVNLILLFVWGFGSTVNPNKKNFARACLILAAVGLVLWIVLGAVLGSILSEIMSGFYGYGY